MSACTFFGHRDCPETILPKLRTTLTMLICQHAVEQFYVGNQGNFDALVRRVLRELQQTYPQIRCTIVLAYLPQQNNTSTVPDSFDTLYPEGIENSPKRFAVTWRNRWMLQHADYVVAYITHPTGGAAQFVAKAEKQQKHVIHLSDTMHTRSQE